MCLFKAPKVPAPPPIPQKEDAAQARVNEHRLRAGARGFKSTVSEGTLLGQQKTQAKTLLGG